MLIRFPLPSFPSSFVSLPICALLMLSVLLQPQQGFAANIVGKVVAIQGKPIVYRGNQRLPLGNRVRMLEGDELVTPANSKVRFKLEDGTTVTLAGKTQFKISKYRFNRERATSDVRFRLAAGAFRAVTGAIGKQANPKLEVDTKVATIGIRGTDFWGGFIFSDALDVTMVSGKGVYIKNEFGQVELNNGGEGTTVKTGEAPTAPKIWSEKKVKRAVIATELIMDRY